MFRKILDRKSSSEQIFFRKLSLGAPDSIKVAYQKAVPNVYTPRGAENAPYFKSVGTEKEPWLIQRHQLWFNFRLVDLGKIGEDV